MEKLNAKIRDNNKSNAAKKSRIKGYVPGIIYGKDFNSIMFEVENLELNSFINKNGEHGTIGINVEGKDINTLIKEVQRDPVNMNIIHLDLEALEANMKVTTEVPIHFSGENKIKSQGGIIQKEKTNIKVECNADAIPKYVEIDLSVLNRGETFRVGDIELAKEISIIDDMRSVIASITHGNMEVSNNVATHEEDLEVLIDNNKKVSESEKPS